MRSYWIGPLISLPPAIAGTALPLNAQQTLLAFTPPESPVILTRSIYLPFPDGNRIAVTRRYELRFSRSRVGLQVDGRLLNTEVEAPSRLSILADLERRRPDIGLFPLLLDPQGMILESQPALNGENATPQAGALAKAIVAKAAVEPGLRHEITSAIDSLSGAVKRSVWPVFLFNPSSTKRSTSQSVTLPNGSEGAVETRIVVDQPLPGRLPKRVERSVTTHLEGTTRTTREVWTFSF